MKAYDHKRVEKKWQAAWAKKKIYQTKDSAKKPKFYILDMFPYPSGEGLHVGHPKGYIATDIVSRMKRMQGMNVLHPMGFDAFGLPAENYALKTKTHPEIAVKKNIARYKKQLEIIGFDYDWSREVNTTDPEFYKWTQWIFLKLYEKGLAYESFEPINWCPSCKTGLANEDVEGGRCERCGTLVEKKPMRQWVLRITEYADRLLSDLDQLDWPESIKESQRNWIGRSEGAEISFKLVASSLEEGQKIDVFTTRPDTLFGATHLVLAPEHDLLQTLTDKASNKEEIIRYIVRTKNRTDIERTAEGKEKTGVELKGVKAINPANGEEIPVFVADYVLPHYGTGAIMAVPAHDERDFAFAKKFKLPIKQVIAPRYYQTTEPWIYRPEEPTLEKDGVIVLIKHWKEEKYMGLKWKEVAWGTLLTGGVGAGHTPEETVVKEIKEETGFLNPKVISNHGVVDGIFYHVPKHKNQHVHGHLFYVELQDGKRAEVGVDEAAKHEVVWMTLKELKNFLTPATHQYFLDMFQNGYAHYAGSGSLVNSGEFTGMESEKAKSEILKKVGGRKKITYKLHDWIFSRQRYWGEPFPLLHDGDKIVPVSEKELPVKLPKVKSYEPTRTGESPLAAISKWVNVKVGKKILKRETNTMPQWAGSSWYYLRFMDPKNKKQLVGPAKEKYWNQVDFYVGGAEHATRHLIYARFWHKFLFDIGIVSTTEPFKRLQSVGLIMGEGGQKMSKRLGNVINPDDIVERLGADSLRLYEMFMGPFDQAIAWNSDGIVGMYRFLERVWRLKEKVSARGTLSAGAETMLHQSIEKIGRDIDGIRFNTAVSQLMVLQNTLEREVALPASVYKTFLCLLAPFAPHITEELWEGMKGKGSVHLQSWPKYDPAKLQKKEVVIAVQVNGKVRATLALDTGTKEAEALALAEGLPEMGKWLLGQTIRKRIYVPGKIVNFVI